ncbi:MAG: amidohydrolase [Chitinophagaceae bacterium]|nr:amidohydrolase [Chitinophagaceae bacterium]
MMKRWKLLLAVLCITKLASSQETFPVNGVADKREGCYAFTNATIIKDVKNKLSNATMVVRDGRIVAVGNNVAIPKDAVVIDCKDKYIYPSFIDAYSDYGMPQQQAGAGRGGFNFNAPAQLESNQKGAYGWNQALHTDVNAVSLFTTDETKAKGLRDLGFGTVLTHQKDGIARGTGAVVTLSKENDNLVVLKDKASAHYSLSKGSSTQSYPSSLMGTIALLRQTYLDAQWYKNKPKTEGLNLSLQSFIEEQNLPQIIDGGDKWNDLRADRIGDEFVVQYIIKGGGNEYQRLKEVAGTKATYIIPLNFPVAQDVEDPNDARQVSLADMKAWELAPTNPAALEKAGIPFVLTAADLRDPKLFTANLRKALDYGLSEDKALEALTTAPAQLLKIDDQVGTLDAGKVANFIITSAPVFNTGTTILQNWVQGHKYGVNENSWNTTAAIYNLVLNYPDGNTASYILDVKNSTTANVIGKDTLTGRLSYDGKIVKLSFSTVPQRRGFGGGNFGGQGNFGGGGANTANNKTIRLSGVSNGDVWQGNGTDTAGNMILWTATYSKAQEVKPDSSSRRRNNSLAGIGKVTYPFSGYGWEEAPQQETILIKNATVWTNEREGKLTNTDVLIKNGKIAQVGKNLSDASAKVIDGTGKHVTAGIIDEHSHIAAASINEGAQSVTSEVRIADNLNPEDVSIYRSLSGGVTSAHILHGSANTIGGQTQLIKLRWGANDDDLKFKGADPFIKFALGENVKRTTSSTNNRFPDTRMGVEEVQMDAFQRAKDYENAWKQYDADKKKNANAFAPRRDLELDALVEIMNHKRFITCHSYVQSEINSTMKVAEKFGFNVNTFTHILEGYKVADKMKAHGANASTFSDWWYYKNEVIDAIPYNAVLMQHEGVNVAINSDDAEMQRRLNQEAAKSIKYGGMSEEDALKMVTLNPAKMLHVDNKVGSIKAGKDADIVIWTDNPLSIYAKAQTTIVDGTVYFDRDKDMELRKKITSERQRLINKMAGERRAGNPVVPPVASMELMNFCDEDHGHTKGLLIMDASKLEENK